MTVLPGIPKIGDEQILSQFDGETVEFALFHDGNQDGNVDKPIQDVDPANDTITVKNYIKEDGGTDSGFLAVGDGFSISGSTGNDGNFTVAAINENFATDNTTITVNEDITDSTPDGTAEFGNSNFSGKGDNLGNLDDVSDITTEPSDGGYTRATSETLEAVDNADNFKLRNADDIVFDNLDQTTGRVDAVAVIRSFQAQGESSPNKHLLFVSFLDQGYLLNQTDRLTVDATTLNLELT